MHTYIYIYIHILKTYYVTPTNWNITPVTMAFYTLAKWNCTSFSRGCPVLLFPRPSVSRPLTWQDRSHRSTHGWSIVAAEKRSVRFLGVSPVKFQNQVSGFSMFFAEFDWVALSAPTEAMLSIIRWVQTNPLVFWCQWEYLRSPAQNWSFFAGYLSDWH